MRFFYIGLLSAIVLFTAVLEGLSPAQTQAEAPLQITNPHYVTINESLVVDAPVDKVWARVGRFCDITEWMNSPKWEDCKYLLSPTRTEASQFRDSTPAAAAVPRFLPRSK